MDSSEFPTGRPSPRRELQGPRPTPLKVRKDSYKIKKPPMAPPPAHPVPSQPQHHPPPVIIYTVSPKVIHTNPSDFMTLVQRLTGSSSSSSSSYIDPSSDPSIPPSNSYSSGALSPAARLATIEKSAHVSDSERLRKSDADVMDQLDIDGGATLMDRPTYFPGILSPIPSSLPPISPSFFSPSVDPNSLSFLHDMSPAFHGNKSFVENTFLSSPNYNFLSTPTIPSPGAYWDLFNQLQDF